MAIDTANKRKSILGLYVRAASSATPTAPTLDGSVISDTEIDLSWVNGLMVEYYKLKRKETDGGSYAFIGGDANNKIYTDSYSDTGLTADTSYTYQVIAYNDSGSQSDSSNEKTIATLATASLPTSTTEGNLLDAIRDAILEIEDADGNYVFKNGSTENAEVGEISHLESRGDDDFPCASIVSSGTDGVQHVSQRIQEGDFKFQIDIHYKNSTPDRADGTDMKSLMLYAQAVKNQMYRFIDKVANGGTVCSGYMLTNPSFHIEPFYQLYSDRINTATLDISFHVERDDTLL